MPLVYAGQYLRVDLSSGTMTTHAIAEDDVRRFLLGSGYVAWLFYREVDPALAWDDPAMPIYVFNGLLSLHRPGRGERGALCRRHDRRHHSNR